MTDISVIVPSYNHAPYIVDAVASVLSQTAAIQEVIVVDDASSDDSLARLRQLDDPRLRIIALEHNRGGSESLNVGIRASRFPLISICNSDDLWEPTKLEAQLRWLVEDPNIGAVFTNVSWIGKYGEELDPELGFCDVFRVKNRSRHAWIRWLVENGNCFCHPSVLVRRSVYDDVGLYDNRFRQLPDYKMWLAILRHSEFHILEEKLVRFRVHDNTSAPSPSASTRDRNEFLDILLDLMANISVDDFFLAFGSRLSPTDPRFNLTVEISLYLWSLTGHVSPVAFWAANHLCMGLLATDDGKSAWEAYGFTMFEFHLLRGIESPWLNARGLGDFTPAECSVLRRVRAAGRIGKCAGKMPSTRPRLPSRDKIKREIRRMSRQVRAFLS